MWVNVEIWLLSCFIAVSLLSFNLNPPGKYFGSAYVTCLQVCWPVCPLTELLTFGLFAWPTRDPSARVNNRPRRLRAHRVSSDVAARCLSVRISARRSIFQRVHRRMDFVTFG